MTFVDPVTPGARPTKPLLRGWLHAVGAVLAVIGTIVLLNHDDGDQIKTASFWVYGLSLIVLLGFSAVYHIPYWSPSQRSFLRRIDHANIFIMIAGTYTPVAAVMLRGAWRLSILIAIWLLAIVGIAAATQAIRSRRRLLSGLYLVMGWIGVIMLPELLPVAGAALLWIVLGGLSYSLGALAYAFEWPKLWPRIFGYHEVFHALVMVASAAFYIFMIVAVVPFRTA